MLFFQLTRRRLRTKGASGAAVRAGHELCVHSKVLMQMDRDNPKSPVRGKRTRSGNGRRGRCGSRAGCGRCFVRSSSARGDYEPTRGVAMEQAPVQIEGSTDSLFVGRRATNGIPAPAIRV